MYPRQLLAIAAFALGVSARTNLTTILGSFDELSSLVGLLEQYPDLVQSLSAQKDITVLAPNNAAIQALTRSGLLSMATPSDVENILSYHVIPQRVASNKFKATPAFLNTALTNSSYTNVTGGQVVEGQLSGDSVTLTSGLKMTANVVKADVQYNNGIVHIIDEVLTVPYNVSTTALAADLTALAGALVATDLLTTLDTASDYTIFAPSNDAFAAIGSAAGNLSTSALASILEYHVINGTIAYSSALGNGSVATLAGADVNITVVDGAIFVNAARVINSDILASGGVIHVIDSVLNPNGTAEPKPNSDQPVVQYSGASSAPLGALTSAIPAPMTTISGLVATTDAVASGYATVTGGAIGTGAGGATPTTTGGGGGGGMGSSSSSGVAALPTGMVGAAALFGGAALVANW